jgi:Yip1 domain
MVVDRSKKPNGLKVVIDTIVAPKAAFESIRDAPTWAWALAIAILVGTASAYLISPAIQHAYAGSLTQQFDNDPHLATLTSEQRQQMLASGLKMVSLSWIVLVANVPLGALLAAVALLLFDKIGGGTGRFASYWAAACNIAVPSFALGSAAKAAIVLLRGVDSFTATSDLQRVIPSLAMLVPGANVKLAIVLSAMTPFAIWGLGLNALALRVIGGVRPIAAWAGAIVLLLIPAVLAFLGVK